jgi:hypothetical protein
MNPDVSDAIGWALVLGFIVYFLIIPYHCHQASIDRQEKERQK